MLKILKYFNPKNVWFIVISTAFIVFQVWLDLKLPDYLAEITKLVQTEGSSLSEVWKPGAYMMICAIGSLIASFIVVYLVAQSAASLAKRLRSMLFDKVESFSMAEMNQFSTASLITRSTNDITQVQTIVAMGLQVMIKAPILAVWAIVKISSKNWQWTLSSGVSVALLLLMIGIVILFAMPKFRLIQGLTDQLNRVTREGLNGLRVIRAYNAGPSQEVKFDHANRELTDANLFTSRLMALMMPVMSLIMSGLSLAIYWIGAYLINGADTAARLGLFSDMVIFSSYAMQIVMAFMMLSMVFFMLPRASVSAKRVMEVLNTEPSIKDGGSRSANAAKAGEIEFRNVGFKYADSDEYVLKDISFVARRGETVAFIGSTGSGKSTLLNLIPRFYDVSEGEVLVQGLNVKDYTLRELHNKLGYVPQKTVLFSGTVTSNVAYGDNGRVEGSAEDVKKAVAIAKGQEFVEKLEGGYEGSISQGGSNLSGGQKQRLSIARAVFRKPDIYIFDDSFSALDYKTDRQLRSMLNQETTGATNLIVGQRIGTIKEADLILVLDEGKIVGRGTHQELLQTCEVYRQIANSQLSKEELEIG
ncbi:ATP-binding cassette subfamily B protein [Paenibacillus endophyticus]|uniref:ATP-binding cassette subfamily B protein n=1 Tax=Paenibacillus endophyticus TaxID=1294268 RepID=A0A7W5C657_9BACL|nr:ABC transporter ATP-binding protein [Paenibacillus endophyticus]MBB3151876.1 ATP-binding cassette subfamily B protein [Paenibacillus endophyticus]